MISPILDALQLDILTVALKKNQFENHSPGYEVHILSETDTSDQHH